MDSWEDMVEFLDGLQIKAFKDAAILTADDLLRALHEAGVRFVPVELSKDMLKGAWDSYVESEKEFPKHFQDEYNAMLDKSPYQPPEG